MIKFHYKILSALLVVCFALASCESDEIDDVIDDSKTVTAYETDADGKSCELHTYFNKSGEKLSEDKFYNYYPNYYENQEKYLRQIHYGMNGFPEWEQLVDTDYQPISEKYNHEYTYYDDGTVESHKNESPYESVAVVDSFRPDGTLSSSKKINNDGSYHLFEFYPDGNIKRDSGHGNNDEIYTLFEWDESSRLVLYKAWDDNGAVLFWQTQDYYDDGSFLMTEYAPDGKPICAKLFGADSICTDETLYDDNGEFSVRQHYELSEDGNFVITEYDRNGGFIRKYELDEDGKRINTVITDVE